MFISPLLGTYLDTDVHFEERMRAEFTEPLSLETRIAALTEAADLTDRLNSEQTGASA